MGNLRLYRAIIGVLLTALTVFLLVSLLSLDPADPPLADYPPNAQIANAGGIVGAHVGGYLHESFGASAYVGVLLLLGLGICLAAGWSGRNIAMRVFGGCLLVLAFSLALGLGKVPFMSDGGGFSFRGGVVGYVFASRLTGALGAVGGDLVLFLLIVCAVGCLLVDLLSEAWNALYREEEFDGPPMPDFFLNKPHRAADAEAAPTPQASETPRATAAPHKPPPPPPLPAAEQAPVGVALSDSGAGAAVAEVPRQASGEVEVQPGGVKAAATETLVEEAAPPQAAEEAVEDLPAPVEDQSPEALLEAPATDDAAAEEQAEEVGDVAEQLEATEDVAEIEEEEDAPAGVEVAAPAPEQVAQEEVEAEAEPEVPVRPPRLPRKRKRSDAHAMASSPTAVAPTGFGMPEIDLLVPTDSSAEGEDEALIQSTCATLEKTLRDFNIGAQVVGVQRGPVVTLYEVALDSGVKLSKVVSLSDDLAMALKAPNARVVAPIPGKNTLGIEIPNSKRASVGIRELIENDPEKTGRMSIPLCLGIDISGEGIYTDLAAAPHLLIAGATGSGKSVCINTIITSILMSRGPDQIKLLLVDPKWVELSGYKDLPHLISPVITDMKKAAAVLEWACEKMDTRYAMLARAGVRNIAGYNRLGEKEIRKRLNPGGDAELDDVEFKLPYIVIVVDEFADMMMVAAKEVENTIIRLSQKSRAVGIHLVLATQRPSVDVITGLIKANMPCRLAFQVTSKVDSRTILDASGAEKLMGKGDMLFLAPGTSRLHRAQGCYVSDEEIQGIVDYWRSQARPEYDQELQQFKTSVDAEAESTDPLYEDAVRVVLENQRGSVSLIQRKLGIGYSRAARMIDQMAEVGLLGEYKGSAARDVLVTLEQWEAMRAESAKRGK